MGGDYADCDREWITRIVTVIDFIIARQQESVNKIVRGRIRPYKHKIKLYL